MNSEDKFAAIRQLNKENKLVLFVGAGISYLARHNAKPKWRLPMWSDLAKRVAKDAKVAYTDFNDALDLFDSIRVERGRTFLEERVAIHLEDRDYSPSDVHRALMNTGISTIYTTNYDSLLTRAGQSLVIATERNYDTVPSSDTRVIYQIHGTLQEMHTLTRSDYRAWEERHPRAALKLTQLAAEKIFLFVGYSLRDPHLSDGILPYVKRMLADRGRPHYAFMWGLKERPKRVLIERDGIEALPINSESDWLRAFDLISVNRKFLNSRQHRLMSPATRTRDGVIVQVNPYKLYLYRRSRDISIRDAASIAGITVQKYKSIERVANLRAPPSVKAFKTIEHTALVALEDAFRCSGKLRVNGSDDLRTQYIEYYIRNRSGGPLVAESEQDFLSYATRAVVFDFDGTLTISNGNETTWEAIWRVLGYDIAECAKYHAMYTSGRITHRKWCEITRDRFRERELTREIVTQLSKTIKLIDGVREVFSELRKRSIPIFIVSGSVTDIIRNVLGDLAGEIDGLFANRFTYDDEDILTDIESTKFDFEGKAHYLTKLSSDLDISPAEILFVGNSINDEFAYRSGVRTLCINPSFTNPENRTLWNYSIRRTADLREIIKYTKTA